VLAGKKVLITEATGIVARPIAEALPTNEVWCLGRVGDEALQSALEAQGVTTYRWVSPNRTSHAFDNTKSQSLIGGCDVDWRAGVRRTIEVFFPGAVKSSV
jgi:hypothetical protein